MNTNTMNTTAIIQIERMEEALTSINFFVGGLTDEAIQYYYNKMVNEGKINSNQ